MKILEKDRFKDIIHFFKDDQIVLWFIELIKLNQDGHIYVNHDENIETVLIETASQEFFYAGKFDEIFIEQTINYIQSDILKNAIDKVCFFYTSSSEMENKLLTLLKPFEIDTYGQIIYRNYCLLNQNKYMNAKNKLKSLDPNYQLVKKDGNAFIYHNNIEIAYCVNNGLALNTMDIDVFVDKNHRRKGLAMLMASNVIDDCLELKIQPMWGYFLTNEASLNLANKLGFEINKQSKVILANF